MRIHLASGERDAVILVVKTDSRATTQITSLDDVRRLLLDKNSLISARQARQLGAVAVALASLDLSLSVRWEVTAVSRLVDAYDYSTGNPELSRAFGEGMSEVLDELSRLDQRPTPEELVALLERFWPTG